MNAAPPSGSHPVLLVRNLQFSFPGQPVLDGIDLALGPGEIYGLLGPNGSGKTTLLRAVCGRLQPGAGEVRIIGLDPAKESNARAAVGLVPQQIAVYGHLTAAENLAVFARLAGMRRDDIPRAVTFALAACGLEDHRDVRVARLSGGYQRRVNLAAGVVHRPRLLLLDEPTVGVDLEARRAIDETLRRLAAEDLAVLMTSHDLQQVESLAHRVGFLRAGRLVAEGRPRDLIRARFGTARELLLVVPEVLAEADAARLRGAGLNPDPRVPGRWTGQIGPAPGAAEASVAELERAGIEVREFRIRRPDLASLYRLINQHDGQPA
jgi:ABC-2 type transport system ATP-binding protein